METVQAETTLTTTADNVWGVIGTFGELDLWHPWVPNCTISTDGRTRTINLGSTKAVERLVEPSTSEFSHSYVVEESPMPVKNYRATLCVEPLHQGCHVTWKAEFDATDASAGALIQRFFNDGLAAIKAQFQ